MSLTNEQIRAISIVERVGGSFSIVGCAFIVTTYFALPLFRKPVKRLIFYASFGNICSAVSSLISTGGIIEGSNSALCQVQAFFIQYWIPADPLWAFCMALNIYLTFYQGYSAKDLKKLEKWYFLLCYGLPLPLAITLLLIETEERGKIYGPALIWCSIREPWQFLRLVCFYGPVWLVAIVTFAIYAKTGYDIFHKYRIAKRANTTLPSSGGTTRSVFLETATNPGTEAPSSYSICVESQQSQTVDRLDDQIKLSNSLSSYMRYSFLFFIAMVVTWLPSSFNRINSLANPDKANFGLNLAGALVLSLQGFWNALIYALIMAPVFKDWWNQNKQSRFHLRSSKSTWSEIERSSDSVSLNHMASVATTNTETTTSMPVQPPF
ncbi:slime mold cyclic AMP receptor-domain-containing protein [Aspergillus leporis]|uniref:Slime mold cyclic AMP receptor-domain-containing protein n=1 Tax=Aspergillus leporis TaxID=41062 RepID=A0A5N5WP08_9EURO|nr:slime mold cyclic AMP receptor-domain-containing protein [Aspergillus leporis]